MTHARKAMPSALPRWRAPIFLTLLGLGFLALLWHDIGLQLRQQAFLRRQGRERYIRVLPIPASRGVIYAANHRPIAVSVPADTLWVDPKHFGTVSRQWPQVARILGISEPELAARVRSGGSRFAYLAHQIDPATARRVMALHLPGLYRQPSSRSYYPFGPVTGPLLGFTDMDHQGATGVELAYNRWLAARAGKEEVLMDGHGQTLRVVRLLHSARNGHALTLTINPQIQYWTYEALAAAVRHFRASGGAAVVMDVRNGHILALASAPSFNPNTRTDYLARDYVDRAVHLAFEPGSVMKPFMIAAALASGSVKADAVFNVSHCLPVGGFCIRDDVTHHRLSIARILKFSSDVGAAEIALRTPRRAIYHIYRAVGFGRLPTIGLPGATAGILAPWRTWGKSRHATIALGYGVTVSDLQLADAYAAIADGGIRPRPVLVAGQQTILHRVMPTWVADKLRGWLEGVTAPNGTGILAAIPGYHVAGKTGTADIHNGKGGFYNNKVNGTFVGFLPGDDPRLVMAVTVRNARRYWNFGGVVAAPVFRTVMSRAVRLLDIPPDIPIHGPTRLLAPKVTTAQAEIWAEGGGK